MITTTLLGLKALLVVWGGFGIVAGGLGYFLLRTARARRRRHENGLYLDADNESDYRYVIDREGGVGPGQGR